MSEREKNKNILGYGVFVEAVSGTRKSLIQFMLTPQVTLPNGSEVRGTRLFRILRAHAVRANWAIYPVPEMFGHIDGWAKGAGVSLEMTRDDFKRGRGLTSQMQQVLYQDIGEANFIAYLDSYIVTNATNPLHKWSFSGEPFVVGISERDFELIYTRNTPQNLVNRIKKIREAKEFPERTRSATDGWVFQKPESVPF